jgi:hypothetical protein
MIYLDSRRKKLQTLTHSYPGAVILDVTSRGPEPWIKFSPFYPHGGIPVPFWPGTYSKSVEGVWQALKVFEREGVDLARLDISTMRGLKRSGRSRGKVRGHQKGTTGGPLLDYLAARQLIYLPCYKWVLDNVLPRELALLEEQLRKGPVVLLDYETNANLHDLSRPLSHAALIRSYVEQHWPTDGAPQTLRR